MPCWASPAIASPAWIDTAIGRKSGSTIAIAASGKSVPSVSTADRNAGPVPGRGPMSVSPSSTATRVGSASMSRIVAQVRRLRTIWCSSTPITRTLP